MTTPDFMPLAEPLDMQLDPEQALLRLARRPHCLLLDSALRDSRLGRYSFLTADPFAFLEFPSDGSDALAELARRMQLLSARAITDLPPFQGGAAGLFSYDLNRSLENVPSARHDEFQVPAMACGLYDVVLAWDHLQQQAWLISQGLPEVEPVRRRRRAEKRLQQFRDWLAEPAMDPARTLTPVQNARLRPLTAGQLAPQFSVTQRPSLTSNFSAEDYHRMIDRAVEYIYAGDIFQVNLAQRLLYPAVESSLALYLRLRRCNPATFAGYFDLGPFQIASASPERFVSVREGNVEARPIKGTRQRTSRPEADLFAGHELRQNEKDRAENVMIVDLLRNDLSRVCRTDSIQVTQLCELEIYQYVQHLVSVVCGRLQPDRTPLDLLRAAFPGGSITGAPKVRAMEIIAELEPTARGPYCGSLGYVGFDGTLDLSILIRTITAGRGWWQMPVGGGIVAQSTPQREYEETWHKAAGLLRALPDPRST